MTVIIFIIVLAVLIFVHELGHFLFARWNNIRVDEFKLGFGPKIVEWKRGETKYGINWIPFGGFVKILGEDGEQALHHVARRGRVGVLIRDREQVLGLRLDRDRIRQRANERFLVRRGTCARVEVGHMDQFFEVRPAEQGALNHIELLSRIDLDCDTAQQRPQETVRIDIDARR